MASTEPWTFGTPTYPRGSDLRATTAPAIMKNTTAALVSALSESNRWLEAAVGLLRANSGKRLSKKHAESAVNSLEITRRLNHQAIEESVHDTSPRVERDLVVTSGLYFCTVISPSLCNPYGVYMRHGSPAGAFWRNDDPIKSFQTFAESNKFIDRLAGVKDAWKAFEHDVFTR